MALNQMPSPKNFSFSKPEEWSKWFCRFQRVGQVFGLSDNSSESQVNMLVYTMDNAADNILSSLGFTDDQKRTMTRLCRNSNSTLLREMSYLNALGSTNTSKGKENQSMTLYTALFCLSDHCQYGNLREEMIRDRIVVGLHDSSLSVYTCSS